MSPILTCRTAMRLSAFMLMLPLFAVSPARAQDYNPDGTPTLRTQCLENPGMCDRRNESSAQGSGTGVVLGFLAATAACAWLGCFDSKPKDAPSHRSEGR